ncbi:uncharacterized protein LOC105156352 [Sesamum indicum]|uniref:Uncharacterized protein LOC105156352 n=1 Tax=Sesamum indicum TaxID=4182 RepID=A0A6I9SML4_SESIN|nr:uncharacterized protein LOC105156352 [Sesamum indicum]
MLSYMSTPFHIATSPRLRHLLLCPFLFDDLDPLNPMSDPISPPAAITPSSVPPVPPSVPLHRSRRPHIRPTWLSDYDCHCVPSSFSCISASSAHSGFVAHLSTLQEPKSYLQACKDKNWVEAMSKELDALAENKTWILTPLLSGNVLLVDKAITVRIFLALATSNSWPLLQLEINNAFFHGFLTEDFYMDPPEGLIGVPIGQVCKLQRSLYGLKQASRQWNLELTTQLLAFGFHQSSHEHCLFVKRSSSDFTVLLVYVDDILLTGSSSSALDFVNPILIVFSASKTLAWPSIFLGSSSLVPLMVCR